MQNQAFYRTGIFGNFFFGRGEFCVFKTGIPGGPAVQCACSDSQSFRSRANSLPGANRPIGPWPIRKSPIIIRNVENKLQEATDDLLEWSHTEGMDVSVSNTKVMLFGSHSDKAHIQIKGQLIENMNSFKYLGVVSDPELNFTMQTDYAVGKAKKASAKVYRLIDGDWRQRLTGQCWNKF